jgi:hypothetical protein
VAPEAPEQTEHKSRNGKGDESRNDPVGAKSLNRLAGAGGFEPPHGGTKIRCLTAWLRPNVLGSPRLIYMVLLPGTSAGLRGMKGEHPVIAPKLHPTL